MKTLLNQIITAAVIIGLVLLSVTQCSRKKEAQRETIAAVIDKQQAQADYLELVRAKQRIDTLYKEGKTVTIRKTQFKAITDTLYIEHGKVYGLFRDSIINEDLTLRAEITASDLRAVSYNYSVREKIIREQTILTEHDTLIQTVRKGQLIGLMDVGLHSYSAGLQYQSRKRLGFTARYNWFKSDGFVSVGVAYRIF